MDFARSLAPLDTTCEVVTPENVQFHYQLAGPCTRAFAFSLDALIKITCVAGIWAIFPDVLGDLGWGIYLIVIVVVEWGYFIFFETKWNGQSPGKRMSRLRVISENGLPLTWQQCVLRNLLRPADQIPLVYGVGVVAMLFTKRFQRLGDLAAGTMVIIESNLQAPPSHLPFEEAEPLSQRIPKSFPVDRELRRTVVLYTHKRGLLSSALCRELAQPVTERLCSLWSLPPDTDPDLLMRALYRRIFSPGGDGRLTEQDVEKHPGARIHHE